MSVRSHIDAAIDGSGGSRACLRMSPPVWAEFKAEVPRREYRKRAGTRFVNSYRGMAISIHDEWSWGWRLVPERGESLTSVPRISRPLCAVCHQEHCSHSDLEYAGIVPVREVRRG